MHARLVDAIDCRGEQQRASLFQGREELQVPSMELWAYG